jgi:hypothetical protein
MTWVKLADTFTDHPKIVSVGDRAAWLYVAALCYCSRHLTNGHIPGSALGRLTGLTRPRELAAKLVSVGLWVVYADGWWVHDYQEYQRTREEVEEFRAGNRERGKEHRYKQDSNGAHNALLTTPDIQSTDTDNPGVAKAPPAARGTRIPDTFQVTDEMVSWVKHECRDIDWELQTANFVDYFKAVSGKTGVKLDWVRTWRKWMRTSQDRIPQWARNRAQR